MNNRDRVLVIAALFLLTAGAWFYTLALAGAIGPMAMVMPLAGSWKIGECFFIALMWVVMMIAMMVPTVSPMILLFASLNRKRQEQQNPYVPTGFFLSGYLAIWTLFSLIVGLIQWYLHNLSLLSSMMTHTSPIVGGLLLIIAGLFQWTPFKNTCLIHCRSPFGFLMTSWREGKRGAFRMGLSHGAYCLGCCWLLMALLFVTGVMNLLWILSITIFVLIEKVSPQGPWIGRIAGIFLIGGGFWMIGHSIVS